MSHSTTRRALLAQVAPAALAALTGATLVQRAEAAPGYAEVTRRAYAHLAPRFDHIADTPCQLITDAEVERTIRDFRRALQPVTEHLAAVAGECSAAIPPGDTSEFEIKLGMLFIGVIADALHLPDECVERLR